MNRAEVFLGTTLESRYRLDAVVRESPDFFVFQGHDLERSAAVEIRMARAMRGMSVEELADAVDVFAVEAEQLRQLSKASTDTEELLASGQVDGPDQEHLAYCVFAHIDGVTLSQVHPKGSPPMPLARAVAMLEPVATVLATAHEIGVFHGDLRPENMIVCGDVKNPTIKLVGFTRATRLGQAARTFSAAYAAPEHFKKAQGENGVGPATDTYALALCVVELVTGQPALIGSSPNELYREVTDITKRPTLRARGASVSEEIDAVIARAVAVNPKLRWPSIRDFWSALTTASSSSDPVPASEAGLLVDVDALAGAAKAAFAGLPPPSVVPAAPAPSRVPMSPPTPSIRALDEGIQDSQPPAAKSSGRKLTAVIGVAILAAVVVVGFVLRRKPPAMLPPGQTDASAPVAHPTTSASATSSASATTSATAPIVARPTPEGMVHIPAGTFTMGHDTGGKGDRPAHHVVLTHAFYIDRTEVTIDKYNACVEKGACTPRVVHLRKIASGGWGCNLDNEHGSHPANCVDRKQAMDYCVFANKRLLTEAEWEYAARGSDEREYPWGNDAPKSCNLAVLSGMTGACGDRHGTSPVGSAPDGASAFAVLDMGGNVWEWVADDYAAYPESEVTDPLVTIADRSTALRGILRGGSWDYGPESAKTTYRLPFVADAGNASTGIRCAQSE